MDFSNLMVDGEAISSIDSVTSEKRGGGTSDLILTDQSISGQTVLVWIAGGTACYTYRITIKITTTLGQELEGDGLMKIEDK